MKFFNIPLTSMELGLAVLTASSLMVSTTSCGRDAEEAVANVVEEPGLQGDFSGPCKASEILDVSQRETMKFEGNSFESVTIYYTNANCSSASEAGRLVYSGTFEIDDEAVPGDANGLNVEITSAEVTPLNDTVMNMMSSANFCGIDRFEQGKAVELQSKTNLMTCPLKSLPGRFYGAYQIRDEDLFLSESSVTSMAESADKRSTKINNVRYEG